MRKLMRKLITALALLSGCSGLPAIQTPGPSATAANHSSYRIDILRDGEDIGSGTAWVAANDGLMAAIVTAGHVCAEDEPGTYSYSLVSQDNTEWPAVKVAFPAPDSGADDLCLLRAAGNLGPALRLADSMPGYNEEVAYVGAPLGLYGDGVAPMFYGNYAGGDFVSIPTAPGASGSAIYSRDGVVGVLVAVMTRFNHLTIMEPLDHLRPFLTAHGVI